MFQRVCSVVGGLVGMVVGIGVVFLLRLTMLHGFLR